MKKIRLLLILASSFLAFDSFAQWELDEPHYESVTVEDIKPLSTSEGGNDSIHIQGKAYLDTLKTPFGIIDSLVADKVTVDSLIAGGVKYPATTGTEGQALFVDADGNIIYGNASVPGGSGSELQYRVNSTTFGAIPGSSFDGSNIDLGVITGFIKVKDLTFNNDTIGTESGTNNNIYVVPDGLGKFVTSGDVVFTNDTLFIFDASEGNLGIHTQSTPLTSLQVGDSTELGTDWVSTAVDYAHVSLVGQDALLELVSSDVGMYGSGMTFKQVDGTTYENAWGIVRKTNRDGTGDGSLNFTYGSNTNITANTIVATIDTVGNFTANNVKSGPWTPAFTANSNLDATPTLSGTATYLRVGTEVSAKLAVNVNVTNASTISQFGITLPIASDFVATSDAIGNVSGSFIDNTSTTNSLVNGAIVANEVFVNFATSINTTTTIYITFQYTIK